MIENALSEVPEGAVLNGFYAVGYTDADGNPLKVVDQDSRFIPGVSGKDADGNDVPFISDDCKWIFPGQNLVLRAGWDRIPGQCILKFVLAGTAYSVDAQIGEDAPEIGQAKAKVDGEYITLDEVLAAMEGWYVTGVKFQGETVADQSLAWSSEDLVADGKWMADKDMRFIVEVDDVYTVVLWNNGVHVANIDARYGEPFSIPTEYMLDDPLFSGYATADGTIVVGYNGVTVPGVEDITDDDGKWALASNLDLYATIGAGQSGPSSLTFVKLDGSSFKMDMEYGMPIEVSDDLIYDDTLFAGYATKGGVFLVDYDGSVVTGVEGITDDDGNWISEKSVTVYAKMNEVLFSGVMNGNSFTVTGVFEAGTDPLELYKGDVVIPVSVRLLAGTSDPELYAPMFNGTPLDSIQFDNQNRDHLAATSVTVSDTVTVIDEGAFEYCRTVDTVVIPETVTEIKAGAFKECSSLTNLEIPDSVESIEEKAFYGCSSLESVELPEGITAIENSTFGNCRSLKSIVIPDTVETIGDSAFSGCRALETIVIPNSVTSIGSNAFCDCSSLKTIVLPDGMTTIPWGAFCDCTSLETVVIPDSVTSIETNAFRDCSSLKSIVIPNGVDTIPSEAFAECSSLGYVYIPASVTSIDDWAFYECGNIAFDVAESNPNYKSVDGALLSKDGTIMYGGGSGDFTIPSSVTTLKCSFSKRTNITSLTIPGSFSIGSQFAYGSTSLESVTILDGVTSIRDYAFCGCTSLKSISIPSTVQSIGGMVFFDCTSLESVVLPEGINRIGGNMFLRCSSLKSVNIPSTVTTIGNEAFYECPSLESITIPNGVTVIDEGTFKGCSSLASVNIPSGVTKIGERAFEGCTSLESINIPASVTTIGSSAFAGSGILSYVVDEANAKYTAIDGALYTKDGTKLVAAPAGASGSFLVPEGVTEIAPGAFSGCKGITSVTFPTTLTRIGQSAFEGCSSLVSVSDIPNNCGLGYYAFRDCTSLKSFVIPEGVSTLNSQLFQNCTALESVSIPSTVSYFPNPTPFEGCINLQSIDVSDSNPNFKSVDGVVYSKDGTALVKVPTGKSGDLIIPAGVNSIYNTAFRDCPLIESVVIPEGVEFIGERAFSGCTSLKSVVIPDSLKTIRLGAFQNCPIESFVFSENVTHVDGGAFDGCTSLSSITFEGSYTTVSESIMMGDMGGYDITWYMRAGTYVKDGSGNWNPDHALLEALFKLLF